MIIMVISIYRNNSALKIQSQLIMLYQGGVLAVNLGASQEIIKTHRKSLLSQEAKNYPTQHYTCIFLIVG